MNCDICGEIINIDGNRFDLAILVVDVADFRAHLECAKVFNDFTEGNRIKYLQSWLKEGSNAVIERTRKEVGIDSTEMHCARKRFGATCIKCKKPYEYSGNLDIKVSGLCVDCGGEHHDLFWD